MLLMNLFKYYKCCLLIYAANEVFTPPIKNHYARESCYENPQFSAHITFQIVYFRVNLIEIPSNNDGYLVNIVI